MWCDKVSNICLLKIAFEVSNEHATYVLAALASVVTDSIMVAIWFESFVVSFYRREVDMQNYVSVSYFWKLNVMASIAMQKIGFVNREGVSIQILFCTILYRAIFTY